LSNCTSHDDILSTLTHVQGPYAFIYVTTDRIYFGKDPMGRRSLLYSYDMKYFVLSSCALQKSPSWIELPVDGIYCLQFNQDRWYLELYRWDDLYSIHNIVPVLVTRPDNMISPDNMTDIEPLYEESLEKFTRLLSQSVHKRVTNIHDHM
jgi:asparagine synthetase B (glutamine-hydrolysing)